MFFYREPIHHCLQVNGKTFSQIMNALKSCENTEYCQNFFEQHLTQRVDIINVETNVSHKVIIHI